MLAGRLRKSFRFFLCFALVFFVIHAFFFQPSPSTDFTRREQVLQSDPENVTRTAEPALVVLEKHVYRSDGLLEVNLAGPHPIFELMEQAEKNWKGKLRRASSSLDEAVQEYRRRYHRNPPRGFDHW